MMRVLILVLLLSGCGALKAGEASDAGFLPKPELLVENRERAPFHGYWNRNAENFSQIIASKKQIHIAPVDLKVIQQKVFDEFDDQNDRQDRLDEAQALADYFREKLFLLAENQHDLRLLREAQASAPTLNIAFVDMVPTKPAVNLIGSIAGFLVPGGGAIKYFGEGSIAMEGFVTITAAEESQLWEQYKDREGQKTRLFSFKDYQKYSHIRQVLDEWAMQILELLTTRPEHKVEDGAAVSLNPL